MHVHDVAHEIFSELRVSALGYGFHSVFPELILLGDVDRLLELFVFAVKQSSDSTAVKKLMGFESTGKFEGFEAIVLFDRSTEALEIFILKVDLVEAFVDCGNVLGLNRLEEVCD